MNNRKQELKELGITPEYDSFGNECIGYALKEYKKTKSLKEESNNNTYTHNNKDSF